MGDAGVLILVASSLADVLVDISDATTTGRAQAALGEKTNRFSYRGFGHRHRLEIERPESILGPAATQSVGSEIWSGRYGDVVERRFDW